MKKLAVVLIGWHYPSQPYEIFTKQKIPSGWSVEYFVVGHRDPKYAINEKKLSHNDNIVNVLDRTLYETPMTKEYLSELGWKYIQGKSGNEWEGANLFLSLYDYKDYDCLLFAGDDCLILSTEMISDLLSDNLVVYENKNYGNKWVPEKISVNYSDWLVLSNTVHTGRQAIRGSFELFKSEVFDYLDGEFPLHEQLLELSARLDSNTSSPQGHNALNAYNTQYWLFMEHINKLGLYDRIKFLSDHYRVSNYVIEAERGLISNNNTPYAPYVTDMINKLYSENKLP